MCYIMVDGPSETLLFWAAHCWANNVRNTQHWTDVLQHVPLQGVQQHHHGKTNECGQHTATAASERLPSIIA
jgi:allantoicase